MTVDSARAESLLSSRATLSCLAPILYKVVARRTLPLPPRKQLGGGGRRGGEGGIGGGAWVCQLLLLLLLLLSVVGRGA